MINENISVDSEKYPVIHPFLKEALIEYDFRSVFDMFIIKVAKEYTFLTKKDNGNPYYKSIVTSNEFEYKKGNKNILTYVCKKNWIGKIIGYDDIILEYDSTYFEL